MNVREVALRANEEAAKLCELLLPAGKRVGKQWIIGDAAGSAGDSMAVELDGPKRGQWYDHAAGIGGDILKLVEVNRGLSPIKASDEVRKLLGLPAWTPEKKNGHPPAREYDPCSKSWMVKSINQWVAPSKAWAYRNAAGKVLAYVCRIDWEEAGRKKKDVIPQRLGEDGKWHWRGYKGDEKRPLYGLEFLLKLNDGRALLVVEGEKTCDSARKHFPSVAVVTWMGGCKNVQKAEWGPVQHWKGPVVVWPDNDDEGQTAALYLCSRLPNARKVVLPDGLPAKWDLADPIPEGISIRGLLDACISSTANGIPEAISLCSKNLVGINPTFIIPNDHFSITESARQIFGVIGPTHTIFSRNGVAVELKRTTDGLSLGLLTSSEFRSRIEGYGHTIQAWKRDESGTLVLKQKCCSEDTASALLSSKPAQELLPTISLVTRCPVLVDDGSNELSLAMHGYHRGGGGILVVNRVAPADMSLPEAIPCFELLLRDFEFQTPSDRSRALSAIITPALRMGGLNSGFCPIDVVEATESQAGKGYLHRVVRAIYGESSYSIARKDGGVGGTDESVSAGLISGRPFIEIDNLRGKVDSQFLEMVLTLDGPVQCRVPHRSEISVDASRVTFQATSNGMEATRDLANRCSITRIRKKPRGYHFAEFPEGDLISHVKVHSGRFLGAVFAVVREWNNQGRPRSKDVRHDFREWAGIMDWIVTKILQSAPLMDGHQAAQERVSNPALSWLRMVAIVAIREGQPDREWGAGELAELCEEQGIEMPGHRPRDGSANSELAIGRIMKRCFEASERVLIDDVEVFRITRLEVDEYRKERPRRTYRFAPCGMCGMEQDKSGKHPVLYESPESMPHVPHSPQTQDNLPIVFDTSAAIQTGIPD